MRIHFCYVFLYLLGMTEWLVFLFFFQGGYEILEASTATVVTCDISMTIFFSKLYGTKTIATTKR